ncbi:MAG: GNAT family N-acetyltransferase [Clostridiales bacterium]|nr:GNAT family N-acetyltransferase [Clostridiales bacterium]
MLKAVLFDMDGVLIDSEPLHAKAFQISMKEYGLDLSEDYCYQFIGKTDRDFAKTLVQVYHLNYTDDDLLASKNKTLKKLEKEVGYPAIPYIKQLVMNLHANGIKLAIASSNSMASIKETADNLGLTEYFQEYVSGMDLEHSKPAPDIFLKAASMLSVDPSECLVIEDSCNGLTAAKTANMSCVGFFNPHSGQQDLSQADIIVEGFEEVDTSFLEMIYCHSHMLPFTVATTPRTILRELCVDDMKALYEIYEQPEIRKYIHDIDDYEAEVNKLEAYIKNVYHFDHFGYWGVFDAKSNQLIGRCGIQINQVDGQMEVELGYLFDPKVQGRGYALECAKEVLQYAFTKLELTRIIAVIEQTNQKSINLAKKLGMQFEKHITHKGCDCDVYVIINE